MKKRHLFILSIVPSLLSLFLYGEGISLQGPSLTPAGPEARANLTAPYGQLPLYFIENRGQVDRRVRYYETGPAHSTFFTEEGITFSFRNPPAAGADGRISASRSILRLTPLGMSGDVKLSAQEPKEGRVNYLVGNEPGKWKRDLPTYGSVTYHDAYPGVDMKFYGNYRQLEYDLVLKPGADPSLVTLEYSGAAGLEITGDGDLLVRFEGGGILVQKKPFVYQVFSGKTVEVEGGYRLLGPEHSAAGVKASGECAPRHSVGFQLASYDKGVDLVIDPVFVYSTYFGGSAAEVGCAIAADSGGNAYVAGRTNSIDFPTKGGYQEVFQLGDYDAFVTKFNASGNALVYSTYLGGSKTEEALAIAVDNSGNAYVAGKTDSTDFPRANAYQSVYGGGESDAFLTKLNANGNELVYSTYLGGGLQDDAKAVAVDSGGKAYVAGLTFSGDFPTKYPQQGTFGGGIDAFAAVFDASGDLFSSSYLGGDTLDIAYAIALSGATFYVAGETRSTDFPTKNARQGSIGGSYDAFVAAYYFGVVGVGPPPMYKPYYGYRTYYSTYLGGTGNDHAYGLAVDASGGAYVTGKTYSDDFPINKGGIQKDRNGDADVFVSKLTPSGSMLEFSTYLGGSGEDYARGIAVDAEGNVWVAGGTHSGDFPVRDAQQRSYAGGDFDGFVTKLSYYGSELIYSTYLGGSYNDFLQGMGMDASGNVYVTGYTWSVDFPTRNPFQSSRGESWAAFITKIGPSGMDGVLEFLLLSE